MSHYNVKPIEIPLRPSWLLAWGLVATHVLALALVLIMPLPWVIRLLLLLVLLTSLIRHLTYQALRRLPSSVTGLKMASDGTFSIRLGREAWVPVKVLGRSFVHPNLTVLNLHQEGRYFAINVILLPDALDVHDFRRLRVCLRWGKDSP